MISVRLLKRFDVVFLDISLTSSAQVVPAIKVQSSGCNQTFDMNNSLDILDFRPSTDVGGSTVLKVTILEFWGW